MKKIEDYLHLYLNTVDVIIASVSEEFRAHFGHNPGHKTQLGPMLFAVVLEGHVVVKPILRKLSSMTEEEKEQFVKNEIPDARKWKVSFEPVVFDVYHGDKHSIQDNYSPSMVVWLLRNGFDLFNLIDDNIAIEAATLNLESKEN